MLYGAVSKFLFPHFVLHAFTVTSMCCTVAVLDAAVVTCLDDDMFVSNPCFSIIFVAELLYLAEWWSSSTCAIYTDDETWDKLGKEKAILLLNHSYEVDWLISWLMCEQIRVFGVSSSFLLLSCTHQF